MSPVSTGAPAGPSSTIRRAPSGPSSARCVLDPPHRRGELAGEQVDELRPHVAVRSSANGRPVTFGTQRPTSRRSSIAPTCRSSWARSALDGRRQPRRVERDVDARQHAHGAGPDAGRQRGDRLRSADDRVLAPERVVVDDLDLAAETPVELLTDNPAARIDDRQPVRRGAVRVARDVALHRARRARYTSSSAASSSSAPSAMQRGELADAVPGGEHVVAERAPPRAARRAARRRARRSAGWVNSVRNRTPSGWRTTRPSASRSSLGLRSTTSSSEKPSAPRVQASARSQTARAARERARPSAPRPRRWTPWPGKMSTVRGGATHASPVATSSPSASSAPRRPRARPAARRGRPRSSSAAPSATGARNAMRQLAQRAWRRRRRRRRRRTRRRAPPSTRRARSAARARRAAPPGRSDAAGCGRRRRARRRPWPAARCPPRWPAARAGGRGAGAAQPARPARPRAARAGTREGRSPGRGRVPRARPPRRRSRRAPTTARPGRSAASARRRGRPARPPAPAPARSRRCRRPRGPRRHGVAGVHELGEPRGERRARQQRGERRPGERAARGRGGTPSWAAPVAAPCAATSSAANSSTRRPPRQRVVGGDRRAEHRRGEARSCPRRRRRPRTTRRRTARQRVTSDAGGRRAPASARATTTTPSCAATCSARPAAGRQHLRMASAAVLVGAAWTSSPGATRRHSGFGQRARPSADPQQRRRRAEARDEPAAAGDRPASGAGRARIGQPVAADHAAAGRRHARDRLRLEAREQLADRLVGARDAGHRARARDDEDLVGVEPVVLRLPQRVGHVPAPHLAVEHRHERHRLARPVADLEEELRVGGMQQRRRGGGEGGAERRQRAGGIVELRAAHDRRPGAGIGPTSADAAAPRTAGTAPAPARASVGWPHAPSS